MLPLREGEGNEQGLRDVRAARDVKRGRSRRARGTQWAIRGYLRCRIFGGEGRCAFPRTTSQVVYGGDG